MMDKLPGRGAEPRPSQAKESRMDHEITSRSIEPMGATVIPATAKL